MFVGANDAAGNSSGAAPIDRIIRSDGSVRSSGVAGFRLLRKSVPSPSNAMAPPKMAPISCFQPNPSPPPLTPIASAKSETAAVARPPIKAINPKIREVSCGRLFLTTTITPKETRRPPVTSLQ